MGIGGSRVIADIARHRKSGNVSQDKSRSLGPTRKLMKALAR
jgi:hypothetical protein